MDRRKFSMLSVTGFVGSLFARGAKAEPVAVKPEPRTPPEEDWTKLVCQNETCRSSFLISKEQTGHPVCPRCGSGWIDDLVLVRPQLYEETQAYIDRKNMAVVAGIQGLKQLKALRQTQLARGGSVSDGATFDVSRPIEDIDFLS